MEKAIIDGQRTGKGAGNRGRGPAPDDMSPAAISYRQWVGKINARERDLQADELRRPKIALLRKRLAAIECELEIERLKARIAERAGRGKSEGRGRRQILPG